MFDNQELERAVLMYAEVKGVSKDEFLRSFVTHILKLARDAQCRGCKDRVPLDKDGCHEYFASECQAKPIRDLMEVKP